MNSGVVSREGEDVPVQTQVSHSALFASDWQSWGRDLHSRTLTVSFAGMRTLIYKI